MKIKKEIVPWFPFSVLIFFLLLMILWNFGIIPTPEEILLFVEDKAEKFGLIGIFVVTFIEGLVFIGQEFPGISFILISIVVFSDSLFSIVILVVLITIALTLSSYVNYWVGTLFSGKKKYREKTIKKDKGRKTFFLALTHPTFLSLYFFRRGMNRKGLKEIMLVPIFMFPYFLLIIFGISHFSEFIREELLTNEAFFLVIFFVWFMVELVIKNKARFKQIYRDFKTWFR